MKIKEVCPSLKPERAAALEVIFNDVCVKYNITSKNSKAAFLAQMAHESGEFSVKTENMNYTTAKRIVEIWPTRFSLTGSNGTHGKLNANDFIKNPKRLGSVVYANRMGNGSPATEDGYTYRGGGFIQITGKEAYQKYADFIGMSIEDTANFVRTEDKYAMDSAAWEYVIEKRLLCETDFTKITKAINGGTIGIESRLKYYNRALAAS